MLALLHLLRADEQGAAAIEYVLIASFIGIAILAALTGVGQNLSSTFEAIAQNL
jgi:pilus assembly protein Flp/PilA